MLLAGASDRESVSYRRFPGLASPDRCRGPIRIQTVTMPTNETLIIRASRRARLYRDIEVRTSDSLADLAEAIVGAYNFSFDHAYGFYSKLSGKLYDSPKRFELFADADSVGAAKSVKRSAVTAAFPKVGSKMTFLFDYGDEWRFTTEVIAKGVVEVGASYPRIVGSVGKAPPQYAELDEE